MSFIQEYDANVFDMLRSPADVYKDFEALGVKLLLLKDVHELFVKHAIGTDFAVEILHRHLNIPAEKRLVGVGAVVTPWSTDLINFVRRGLGDVVPAAIHVHNGVYYPYEFVHVPKVNANQQEHAAEAQGGVDRFAEYSTFLEDFARFVQEKGIAHILGLRLLPADERRRAEDPTTHYYEVTDSGDHMITLPTSVNLEEVREFAAFSWVYYGGRMHIHAGCLVATSCICSDKCSCRVQERCRCPIMETHSNHTPGDPHAMCCSQALRDH